MDIYAHVTPRVPRRRTSSRGPRPPLQTPTGPVRMLQRELEDAVSSPSSISARPRILSPLRKDAASREIARNVLGALAREYGGFRNCPRDSLDLAYRVAGLHDPAETEALHAEIERDHEAERQRDAALACAMKQRPVESMERRRALLEMRLRYHAVPTQMPKPPDGGTQRPATAVVGRSVRVSSAREQSRSVTRSTSPPQPHLAPSQQLSPTPPTTSRSSSRANRERSPKSPQRPQTAPLDERAAQLELMNFRRVLNDVCQRLPQLLKFRILKKIDPGTLEGQVQLFGEAFQLMDTEAVGDISAEQFVLFGRRLGGSECCRVFSKRMFLILLKTSAGGAAAFLRSGVTSSLSSSKMATNNNNNSSAPLPTISKEGAGRLTRELFLKALFPNAANAFESIQQKQAAAIAAAQASADAKLSSRWEDRWDKDDLQLLLTMFRGCDRDNNGLVSAEDILLFATSHNREKLSEYESSLALRNYQTQLAPFDKDGDGMVTLEEFAGMQRPVFDAQQKREEREQVLYFKGVKAAW